MNKCPVLLGIVIAFCLVSLAQAQMTFEQRSIDNDLNAVSTLIRITDYQRAEAMLEKMRLTYGDDNRILALFKQVYREAKVYQPLESEIRRELKNDPLNPNLLIELGEARFLQDDNSGADSLWNWAIQTAGKELTVYYYLAATKLRYGLNEAAIEVYLIGRTNIGNPSLFSMELAGIYESLKEYPRATEEYISQAIESPDKLQFVLTKVRGMMEDDENPQEIIDILNRRIKESPGKSELYEILGDLYIKQNQMDKALECFKTIGLKQNDDGQSLIRFAVRAFDSRAFSTAISAIDEYYKQTKNGAFKEMAALIKAKSQMASGQTREALANFRELNNTAVDYRIKDEAGFSVGLIYAQEWNLCDSALMIWDSVSKAGRDPSFMMRTRLEMAVCYLKSDETEQARSLLQLVAAGKIPDANTERAVFLLGDISFYEGKFRDAIEQFKGLVKQFPQGNYSNDALARINVIAATDGDSTSPALKSFAVAMKAQVLGNSLRAAQILSDSSFKASLIAEQALYFSSIAYAQAGKRENAISGLRRYIESYTDGLYIDRAYFTLGDLFGLDPVTYPDAKSMYSKILEAFPGSPMIEQARQRLLLLSSPGKIG